MILARHILWTLPDPGSALEPLVQRIEVLPLTDPAWWGKEIVDERYLLVADL